jgi:hypothetical protein
MRHRALRFAATVVGALAVAACGSGTGSGSLPAPSIASVSPTSGPATGGTLVTIAGASFQNGATVQFGSAQATAVTVAGPTSLSATTPAGAAGAVSVTVTNPDLQSAVLPSGFTYVGTCTLPAAVTSNMTLDPSCVWTAPQTVLVGGPSSPVLTIQPGTTIHFASGANGSPGAALRVGADGQPGGLAAIGSVSLVITFTSASATPAAGDWGGVVIGPLSLNSTSLEYTNIDYAGGPGANDLPGTDAAALTVEGGDAVGLLAGSAESPTPFLTFLKVENSAGHGVVFAGIDTGFGPHSADVKVMNWEMTAHYPLVIEANQGGTIPTSISAPAATLTPTAVVAFHTYSGADHANVVLSETWPAIALPYLVVETIQVAAASGDPAATLTIATPNTVEFTSGSELDIDPNSLTTGFLQANGTASASIIFTSNQAQPNAGAWAGINFWCVGNDQFQNSSLTYSLIEYATSTNEASTDTGEIAILNGTASAAGLNGPTITNCTFDNYADFGIAMVDISNNPSYSNYVGDNVFQDANDVVLHCSGQLPSGLCTSEP